MVRIVTPRLSTLLLTLALVATVTDLVLTLAARRTPPEPLRAATPGNAAARVRAARWGATREIQLPARLAPAGIVPTY
jgi:hypothetical protein